MNLTNNFRTRSLPLAAAWLSMAFAVPLLSTSSARAQEACGDTTCPKGFECKEESGGCPAIACLDASCPPCMAPVVHVCRSIECSADADCASDMTCKELTQTACSGGASVPRCAGGDCAAPAPADEGPDCVTTSIKQCVPRWSLPCEKATDCGVAGFTCEPEIARGCSGSDPGAPTRDVAAPSAGTGGAASSGSEGIAPSKPTGGSPSTPPECTSEPTGRNYCKIIETACTSDQNCPSGFSCQDNQSGVCSSDSSMNTECTPANPPKLCLPPYYDLGNSGRAGGVLTNDSATPGMATGAEIAADVTASGGGCSISGGTTSGSLGSVLAMLGLAVGFGLRRKRELGR